MKKRASLSESEYPAFLAELKNRIFSARMNAARVVNRELIRLYWDIGKHIVERQAERFWGESVIERLADDLQRAFPELAGFSARNLRDMKRFHVEYTSAEFWRQAVAKLSSDDSPAGTNPIWRQAVAKLGELAAGEENLIHPDAQIILEQLVQELPWGHHLQLMNKVTLPAARLFYLRATAQFGWSRNVLLNQIKAGAYERSLKEGKSHNFGVALPEALAEQAEEALKSSYNLEFLGIGKIARERDLENALIGRVQQFILELGYGFCFIGRQHRLALGSKEYFVDLLFYHRFLKALVAVDLKVGSFEPEFAGKMDFYLNLLNEKERAADDRPSIGIILCAEKDNLEVEFSLKTKTNPIGVAEYQLRATLPKELRGKLPSANELRSALLDGMKPRAKSGRHD